MLAACAPDADAVPAAATTTTTTAPAVSASATTTDPNTIPAITTSSTTSTSSSTSTSSTTTSTTTSTTSTSTISTSPPTAPPLAPTPALDLVVANLASRATAVSLSLTVDGALVYQRASGTTIGGSPMTPDSPMVVASLSKLVTALTIARLVERGDLALDQHIPWTAMGIAHHPAWDDVTVRELLTHRSGMPIARRSWLDDPGGCSIPLADAIAKPPREHRGTWVYSNGNFCALGLLIEHVTGKRLDAAAQALVFGPAGVTGPRLTIDGPQPGDAPYRNGIDRFDRLGGAGGWLASTDDLARMLTTVTDDDRVTLAWPTVFADQYGWGHTGTVDGAVGCAWVLDRGRVVVVAVVAGRSPSTGGAVCDAVVPAAAADLGLPVTGRPERTPQP